MHGVCLETCVKSKKNLGGIVLTASHNPGGIRNDFGIKYNIENGGPAPDQLTDEIYELTKKITQYKTTPELDCEFSQPSVHKYEVGTHKNRESGRGHCNLRCVNLSTCKLVQFRFWAVFIGGRSGVCRGSD